jgi:hypothetical protein
MTCQKPMKNLLFAIAAIFAAVTHAHAAEFEALVSVERQIVRGE